MIIRLDVPYDEKDLAKANGAKWNPNEKTWFTDDMTKLSLLSKWLVKHNVICENLYILKMSRLCWKCKKETYVVCLGSDRSFSKESNYQMNTNIQLFSYVESMPIILGDYMKHYFAYYPSFSKTIDRTYYVNHCNHCGVIQGDNYNHEVPEEAFYKKLCYKKSKSTEYFEVNNRYYVPLEARLPYYDEVSSSYALLMNHVLEGGPDNRAAL